MTWLHGPIRDLANAIIDIPHLRAAIVMCIGEQIQFRMHNTKHSSFSDITYNDLMSFTWDKCLQEVVTRFPNIVTLCASIMLPAGKVDLNCLRTVGRKISFIFGIMAHERKPTSHSSIQRIITLCLQDHMADQKVNMSFWHTFLNEFSKKQVSNKMHAWMPHTIHILCHMFFKYNHRAL